MDPLALILPAALALPLLLALVSFAFPGQARIVGWIAPLASLPALVLALGSGETRDWSWLLLETEVGTDGASRPMLALVGIAWSLAAWFAGSRISVHRGSFWGFWMLCLFGLVLALVARDVAAFYLGYATVSLSAWGLVIHNRDELAMRAGRIYLILAIAGEAMILVGLLQIAAAFGNANLAELPGLVADQPLHQSAGWFLLTGFAIKMGLVPLHFWLPLAHPVAPVPASAILSGVIVKAGLLGWLRLAPVPMLPAPFDAAGFLAMVGLISLFGGALMALTQQRAKTILAYSTISQMGLVAVAFSLSLALENPMPGFLGLLLVHHGLNKAALFLAAGCTPGISRWRLALVAVSGLSLIGFPLTSGFLAKALVKAEAYEQAAWMVTAITLSSLATALVMVHLLACMARSGDKDPAALHPAWVVMTIAGVGVPWIWFSGTIGADFPTGGFADGVWPLLAALAIYGVWSRLQAPGIRLPEGDVVVALEHLVEKLARATIRLVPRWKPPEPEDPMGVFRQPIVLAERWLTGMPAVGLMLLALSTALWWVLN